MLKKRERMAVRENSGALEVVGLFSSFLFSEQSKRLPRWAGGKPPLGAADGKAQAGLSGSGYEYPTVYSLYLGRPLAVFPRLLVSWRACSQQCG